MTKRPLFAILFIGALFFFYSACKKEQSWPESIFYGKWKTSYGDTVTFSRQNNKHIVSPLNYSSLSPGPGPWVGPAMEYAYIDSKLFLNDNPTIVNQFRELQSFTWVHKGSVFTVQNTDWFPFMSSISTFTFTRIE